MRAESIDDLFDRYGPAYKWLATVTCMIGGMTAILASSTVNVAFPDIMGAFGIGRDQAQLLTTGYFAATTAGMLISSWLIESFGERTTYTGALLGFIAGAAMSGLAQNPETLMIGRVLQGAAAGIVQPLAMTVTFSVFPSARKGTSMGIFSMGMVLAPIFGPTMGGIAIEYFNWRYVFLLTLPSTGIAMLMGILFMPSREMPKVLRRFDFFGFALFCAAMSGLLLGFSYGQRLGWTSNDILSLFVIGIAATIGFALRQIYGNDPFINLTLFRNVQFVAASAIALFAGCAFLSSTFMIPLFVQQIQNYTPFDAGLMMMPGGLSLLLMYPLTGRLADTWPPHVLIYIGLICFGIAFLALGTADVNTPFWTIVLFTIFIRAGTAFTRPVTNAAALRSLPPELLNQGSGAVNLMRQLGAIIGTNGLVVFLELRIPFHGDAFAAMQTAASRTSQEMRETLVRLLTEAGVPQTAREPGALHYLGDVIYAQASTLGFQDAFAALGIVTLFGLIPAWIMSATRKEKPVRFRRSIL